MINRILMTMALLLSLTGTAFAKDVQFKNLHADLWEKRINITTDPMSDNFEPNPKDWVGIYKVDDANDWANVKLWMWAKNFKPIADSRNVQKYTFKDVKLPAGQYEARYFLNNSFTTRLTSEPFIITSDKLHGYYSDKSKSLYMEVRKTDFNPNEKDWIGIYKQGDSNDWKNVIEWVWAKNLTKNPGNFYYYQFENPSLSSGVYEIRYFLNNTFLTHEQSRPFNVQVATNSKLYGYHNMDHKTTYITQIAS